MANGRVFAPVTPNLLKSFVMPDNVRTFGIAPVSENRAWAMELTWPVVVLIDTDGHIHQTGYAYKELKKIREKSGLNSMVEAKQARCLEGHTITADDSGNCFILTSEREKRSIQHIDKTGTVSTVLQFPPSSTKSYDIIGLAYLIESSGRRMVLFGDFSKGICSVKWPRNWMASLFMSPVVDTFYAENKDIFSISVDKKSDLICISTFRNKIIVFNRKGQKVSEYVGEVSEEFINQEVIFDHTGCILVFNKTNGSIVRLSPDGHLIQTLFPEIKEGTNICDSCKKLNTPPKCRECKDKILITAIEMYEDILWVCRLSGEVEIYRLL
jgi:hypothetical protein